MQTLNTKPHLQIKIVRKAPPRKLSPFTDYFHGFEKVEAVRKVFGEETEEVLSRLKIGFTSMRYMYMGINDEDGNLGVGTYHLEHSSLRTLYLDVVHELFHVKQYMQEGKEYFHAEHMKYLKNGFDSSLYYQNSLEIPAYEHTVREAERIGMSYDEIAEYLKIGEVDPEVFQEFLRKMKIKPKTHTKVRIPIRVNRKVKIPTYPFTDYFKGFESTEAIRPLFGEKTEQVLGQIKVEFTRFPFMVITPSEDGHLLTSEQYLEKGDVKQLYVDVVLCMNLLKRFSERAAPSDSENQEYGDSPVIIESYKAAVQEARRIGVTEDEILSHLAVGKRLMSPEGYKRFLNNLGLKESE